MFKFKFISLFFIFVLFPLASSQLEIGQVPSNINGVDIFIPVQEFNNNTAFVNSSAFWCTTNQGCLTSTAQIDHNLLNNLAWSVAGHTIDEDVDWEGFGIFDLEFLNFSDTNAQINYTTNLTIRPSTSSTSTNAIIDDKLLIAPNYNPTDYGVTVLEYSPTFTAGANVLAPFEQSPTVLFDTALQLYFAYSVTGTFETGVSDAGPFESLAGLNFQPLVFGGLNNRDLGLSVAVRDFPTHEFTMEIGNANSVGHSGMVSVPTFKVASLSTFTVESVKGADVGITSSAPDGGSVIIEEWVGYLVRKATEVGANTGSIEEAIGFQTVDQNSNLIDVVKGISLEQSAGTDLWNIYASGTADNYIEGDVGISTGGASPRSILHLEEAVGIISLEGSNPGSASPIFSIQWINTDTITDYIAAEIRVFNQGATSDGDMMFLIADNGVQSEALHLHDSGIGEFNFDLNVSGDINGLGNFNIRDEITQIPNSWVFEQTGSSVGFGYATDNFFEFDIAGALQMSLTTDALRFNNPTTITSWGFEDEGRLDFQIGGNNEMFFEDNLFAPTNDNEVDAGNGTLRFKDIYVAGNIFNVSIITLANNATITDNSTCLILSSPNGGTVDAICDP